jgi:hypothetical protein
MDRSVLEKSYKSKYTDLILDIFAPFPVISFFLFHLITITTD